jgi:nitrate reductase gamma subunit
MDLLEFARGALQFSFAVAVLGSLWRLVGILRIGNKPDHSEPRRKGGLGGALKVIWTRSLGAPAFKKENFHLKTLGYTFHIGMFITILFLAGHVEWFRELAGFGWPVLPDLAVYVIGYLTVAILLVMLYRRLTHPVLKMLSNFDDYFSWLVTVAPLVTGLAIPLGLGMAEETLLAIHVLSVALLLVWLPFGKLAHAYLIFLSRGTTGAVLERRGART